MTTAPPEPRVITEHENEQVQRANETGLQPVVFIHGLWLLPSSWDRWATRLRGGRLHGRSRRAGPTIPQTVEEANAHPEVFAHKTVGQVADHFADVIGRLTRSRPSSGTPSAGC